jgi:hypothetical protein
MDMNSPEKQTILEQAGIRRKSLFCKIIFYSTLTYFLILALLFIAGSVFSGKIMTVISSYYDPGDYFRGIFLWFTLTGSAVYLAASSGIILMMNNRKAGFYTFFTAILAIFILDLYFLEFDWLRYLIHSGSVFILGIVHFSKRCYS